MMNTVLEVQLLRKSYGSLEAVAGVSFSVARGSIFGLLGHNGAGNTTTIECILGTRSRDAGSVSILGMDSIRDRRRLFERVGVHFQNTRFQDRLRVVRAAVVDEDDLVVDLDLPKRLREPLSHDGNGLCVLVAGDDSRDLSGPRLVQGAHFQCRIARTARTSASGVRPHCCKWKAGLP